MNGDTMSKEKEKSFFSDEDWELLLPGKDVKLGSKILVITPLCLENFVTVVRRIMTVVDKFSEAGITQSNFSTPEKVPIVAGVLMDYVPDVLSLATGIPVLDLKRLPLTAILELVNTALDVNLESQDGLEKNLQALVGKIKALKVQK